MFLQVQRLQLTVLGLLWGSAEVLAQYRRSTRQAKSKRKMQMELLIAAEMPDLSSFLSDAFLLNLVTF